MFKQVHRRRDHAVGGKEGVMMQGHAEKRSHEMALLAGKVVIVTGASNGIGRAIAERLAQDNAMVVVNYGKSAEKAKAVVAEIESKGGQAVAIHADMSKIADVRRLVNDTVKKFGRLDILVNNAGMFISKALVETTEEEFDQIFALNAKGPYFAMQEAAKVIRDGGRIVNISTDGTHMGFSPVRQSIWGAKAHLSSLPKGWPMNWHPGVSRSTLCRQDSRKRRCCPMHFARRARRC